MPRVIQATRDATGRRKRKRQSAHIPSRIRGVLNGTPTSGGIAMCPRPMRWPCSFTYASLEHR